jgi:hypothetical protein
MHRLEHLNGVGTVAVGLEDYNTRDRILILISLLISGEVRQSKSKRQPEASSYDS